MASLCVASLPRADKIDLSMSSLPTATIRPARRVRGRLRVPGDKSISHRYALLAALAEGRSSIANPAPGADCRSTLACLAQLGIQIDQQLDGTLTLLGRGSDGLGSPAGPLDAGNSGTTMRLLAGMLAPQAFSSTLVGDPSLSRRPMRRVIEPLELMGARIEAPGGHAPLTIHGAPLHAIEYRLPVPSAQVKSAVLLGGLLAAGVTCVTEPAQTRDHTERALSAFGVDVRIDRLTVSVAGGQRLSAQTLRVPGDFSSAAFWMVAAAALPGSRVEIDDVGLNPTRTALIGVLRRFGARVTVEPTGGSAGEPRGSILVEGDRAGAIDIAPEEVPGLIDELPAIAALAAHGGEGFRNLGIDADEHADGFAVHGRGAAPPASVGMVPSGVADARGDHRMAMAFAIAALAGAGPSTIEGADAVGISYPGFFETLERLIA